MSNIDEYMRAERELEARTRAAIQWAMEHEQITTQFQTLVEPTVRKVLAERDVEKPEQESGVA